MSEKFPFCPICQLPLKSISISPEVHVSRCMSRLKEEATEGRQDPFDILLRLAKL